MIGNLPIQPTGEFIKLPMSEYKEKFKKEDEMQDLLHFIKAYERATGQTLEVLETIERPDFICLRDDQKKAGIELTKVTRGNTDLILCDKIVNRREFMSLEHAIELIQFLAIEKDKKRTSEGWSLSSDTILVIQLIDIPLASIKPYLEFEMLPDLLGLGFVEIWLADYTGVEAYDDIELFGVYPEDLRGYYPRRNPYKKPYG